MKNLLILAENMGNEKTIEISKYHGAASVASRRALWGMRLATQYTGLMPSSIRYFE